MNRRLTTYDCVFLALTLVRAQNEHDLTHLLPNFCLSQTFNSVTLLSSAVTHLSTGQLAAGGRKLITIRPIVESDRAEWQRLFTDYLTFYESSVSSEVYDTSFKRLLGDDENDFHGALAEVDGKPVGLVHYLFHRHMWRVENVVYLQDLYADPDIRGKGIGRALIEHVYAEADKAGCPSVYWLTQDFNATARKLYDRVATLSPFIKYARP